MESSRGKNAASLLVAEKYVKAFGNLAQTNNTIILPANANDISGKVLCLDLKVMSLTPYLHISGAVAQALTIYKSLNENNKGRSHVDGDLSDKPLELLDLAQGTTSGSGFDSKKKDE